MPTINFKIIKIIAAHTKMYLGYDYSEHGRVTKILGSKENEAKE